MLGVVIVHCSLLTDIPADMASSAAAGIMRYLSRYLLTATVPAFFIISGFLFFQSVRTFTRRTYIAKLKNRYHSLVVPYLLWNLIAAAVFIIKVSAFGYPGYGIVNDNHVDLLRAVAGFADVADGYPYDFPLWFIRNLIVMVLISPIFYILARYTWTTLIAVIASAFFTPLAFHGGLYFLIGAWLALHRHEFTNARLTWISTLLIASVPLFFFREDMSRTVIFICVFARNIGMTFFAVLIGRRLSRLRSLDLQKIPAAAFFIYAFHGLYCSLLRSFILKTIGSGSSLSILLAYTLSVATLIATSLLVYALIRRFFPRILAPLTGSRIH